MTRARRFEGRTVIVTGAAQGIGRGVALALAQEGAQLVLADRSQLIEEVLAEVRADGAKAVAVNVDLETWEGAENMVAAALAAFGAVDVLINNVGGTIWAKPFQEYAPSHVSRSTLATTAFAPSARTSASTSSISCERSASSS